MKKYFNKITSSVLLLAAAAGFSSCHDALYIEPKTFVSEDNFWNEKTDIDQMVAGVYVKMQSDAFIRRCIVWGELRSDNTAVGYNADSYLDFYRTITEDLYSTNSFTDWTNFYKIINECNIIIERAPEVSEKDPTYTESDVRATQAEMSCIRDLCYFYLVRAFQDVPYYTKAIQDDEGIPALPAVDGDQIVKSLIADLEGQVGNAIKAYPKDSNKNYNSSRNRVTRNCVYALLADLCLWDGQYQKCADYCQQVIDAKYAEYEEDYTSSKSTTQSALTLYKWTDDKWSNGYPLYPCFSTGGYGNDYDAIFGTGNSFESIFELGFTYSGDNSYLRNNTIPAMYGCQMDYYVNGTKESTNNSGKGFVAADEQLITDPFAGNSLFTSDDARYYTTLYNSGASNGEFTSGYVAKNVYSSISFTKEQSAKDISASIVRVTPSYASQNWIFYRLTDVMLMQAEALAELSSDFNTANVPAGTTFTYNDTIKHAFSLIWTVNRRSIMENSATKTNANELSLKSCQSKQDVVDLCLKERRRELMFEGKRWFDLIRQWHKHGDLSVVPRHTIKGGSAHFVNPQALFWPYNKEELKNNPDLKQKSFYGNDGDDDSFSSTK